MSLTFIKSGILNTVQDLGRRNFRRFGVNPNGVMDRTATRLINILLGNDENEAVVELHFPAGEIRFDENTFFALGGADFSAKLNDAAIENWRVHFAPASSVLKFPGKISGNRLYFSIKGGLQIEKWLGSRSTNLQIGAGGFQGEKLLKGDCLKFNCSQRQTSTSPKLKISPSIIPFYSRFPTVRIIAGAEFELLTTTGKEVFLSESFVISNRSNRMGFRLEGQQIELSQAMELVSSAVNFGTIQLLLNGQTIILMADHQTSGGYPRIAHLAEIDLPLAAQLGANDKIGFHLISLEEAENLRLNFERDLNLLKIAVKFNY